MKQVEYRIWIKVPDLDDLDDFEKYYENIRRIDEKLKEAFGDDLIESDFIGSQEV